MSGLLSDDQCSRLAQLPCLWCAPQEDRLQLALKRSLVETRSPRRGTPPAQPRSSDSDPDLRAALQASLEQQQQLLHGCASLALQRMLQKAKPQW